MAASKRATLKKSLGFAKLSLYGIGTIIGAGIYSVIGPAAGVAGDAIWISFIIAAAISALSCLSYAELASAMPNAGAEHNFLRQSLPKAPGVAFAIGLFIAVHGAATFSTVALTFANYAQSFLPLNAVLIAIVLMLVATGVNLVGVTKASGVSAALTVTQVSCLILFAVLAITANSEAVPPKLYMPENWNNWSGILQGAAIVFFIYSGYEHMATLAEETTNPARDIWRAFTTALLVTTATYLLVVFGVLAIIDTKSLAVSNFPLIIAATNFAGWLGTTIAFAALFATANAVLSASLSGSRLLFAMARAGDLPKLLQRTLKNSQSPWVGALVMLAVGSLFVLLGEIKFVASISSLGVTLVFASINAALIVLRYTKPNLRRPFKVPSIGRFPVTAFLGVIFSLLLSIQYDWSVYLAFFSTILAGALPYTYLRFRTGRK